MRLQRPLDRVLASFISISDKIGTPTEIQLLLTRPPLNIVPFAQQQAVQAHANHLQSLSNDPGPVSHDNFTADVLRFVSLQFFLETEELLLHPNCGSTLKKFLQVGTAHSFNAAAQSTRLLEVDDPAIILEHSPHDADDISFALHPSAASFDYFSPVEQTVSTGIKYTLYLNQLIFSILNCASSPNEATQKYYSENVSREARALWYFLKSKHTFLKRMEALSKGGVPDSDADRTALAQQRRQCIDKLFDFASLVFSEESPNVMGSGNNLTVIRFLSCIFTRTRRVAGLFTLVTLVLRWFDMRNKLPMS